MNRIDKPWGHEIWFAETDKYVGKILFVAKGKRLSLQYHERKDETLYVVAGGAWLTINGKGMILAAGEAVHIPPLTKHRIEAVMDTSIVEVSTPDADDVIRLEDDYGRVA